MEKCSSGYGYAGWPQYDEPFILPWPPHVYPHAYPCSSSATVEDREVAASKSHSQAEKRRRERINGHLATLRRLIPRSDKMDKAALLERVVTRVKELKRTAVEVGKILTIPTDVDEVSVDYAGNGEDHNDNKDCILFKASVCCEDRPDLFIDISQALQGLKLRTVKADMATIGGRVMNVMIICTSETKEGVCLSSLKQSIKAVLSRVVSLSMPLGTDFSSKRQRMLSPSAYSHISL